MKVHSFGFFVFFLCDICSILCDFDPLSDNILYDLNWPGPISDTDPQSVLQDENAIFMTTKDNEQYKCILPNVDDRLSQEEQIDAYRGLTELELLSSLFKQTTCSYRLESYWTYELCHGKSLRQYHEEKEVGKEVKLQEYFLGRYLQGEVHSEKKEPEDTSQQQQKKEQEVPHKKKVPSLKIEGIELPYFAVQFEGGTPCDLTGTPRRASIRYVCQPDGKGEIYELKETSTCEYALVVLTSSLCTHPAYEPKKEPVNEINCHSLTSSPRRPVRLDDLEKESNQGQYNRRAATVLPKKEERTIQQRVVMDKKVDTPISPQTGEQLLKAFLRGEYCIPGGGTGWWKHEFCFGKKVAQFHEEGGRRTEQIMLGIWDEEDHIKWTQNNPSRAPREREFRRSLFHYYGTGDVCELTGRRRFTEVKLKCKEDPDNPNSQSISIYLVEPNPCEYLLVVESPLFCDLLKEGDDVTGLLKIP